MREAAISIATLVGLVGLVAIFNSNGGHRSKRSSEVVEMGDIEDIEYENSTDSSLNELDAFIESLGWKFNELPTIIKDDVKVYQDEESDDEEPGLRRRKKNQSSKGFKLTSGNIKKCLTDSECFGKAQEMFAKQATTINDLMVASGSPEYGIEAAGDLIPNDDEEAEPEFATSEAGTALNSAVTDNDDFRGMIDNKNMFAAGNIFLAFIMPSGIPLSSPMDGYRKDFNKFNRLFRAFVETYIKPMVLKQKHVSLWIGREDRKLSWTTKQPIKYTAKRFPMTRIIKLIQNPVPSAYQPTVMKTISTLENMVDTFGASKSQLSDCFTIWIHHNMPLDASQFLDPATADRIMELNKQCTITHVWVGFSGAEQERAIRSLQQFLQPEQTTKTMFGSDNRNWFVFDGHNGILGEAGSAGEFDFMHKLYSNMVTERLRLTCQMATPSFNFGSADADYYTPTDGPAATTEPEPTSAFFTASTANSPYDKELVEGAAAMEGTTDPPIWACCGIGVMGVKYNSNMKSCCDDGSVKAYGDGGQDGCVY